MLIKTSKQSGFKYENPTPDQARFLNAAQEHMNEGLNEIEFERGTGSGLGNGLVGHGKKRLRVVHGQVQILSPSGEWVPYVKRRRRWIPKRVHIATGRRGQGSHNP